MKRVGLVAAFVGACTVQAAAAGSGESRMEHSLKLLDPSARLEQVCDMAAMAQIRREAKEFRPDRAMASAIAEPKAGPTSLEAKGAAFRSKGKWYQLSYVCQTTPDQMKVLSFDYKIGGAIPEDRWDGYGLPR
jgi:hypothetical protein